MMRHASAILLSTTLALSTPAAEARRVRVNHQTFSWPVNRAIRVAHLTDLHVGLATPRKHLRQALDIVRRARPDLVVLTGDYLNQSLRRLPRLKQVLEQLPRDVPRVAVLGNHDHKSGARQIQATLEGLGIQVLRNRSARIKLNNGVALDVVGVDDGFSGHANVARAFAGVPAAVRARALVLTHDPRTAEDIGRAGGRLVLAGHTHGGQFDVPVLSTLARHIAKIRYKAGLYEVSGARLLVNTGIGSTKLRRVGKTAAPEVAIIDLQAREARSLR
jgi:predicted MPP superfamily phosphohydrolase